MAKNTSREEDGFKKGIENKQVAFTEMILPLVDTTNFKRNKDNARKGYRKNAAKMLKK